MQFLQLEHHNTENRHRVSFQWYLCSSSNICNPLSLLGFCSLYFFFFLYAAESKIYLHIEKAQQTVKYIHPKDPHARIMHAEIGNCHMEIDDRPQVSK